MIPYATFTYFGVLLYAVVPSIAAGLIGRAWLLRRLLLVLATVGMLLVQYGGVAPPRPDGPAIQLLWLVAGFALVQWTLAWALLLVRQRRPGRDRLEQAAFLATVGLALVPLVVARAADIVPGASVDGFVELSYLTFRAVDVRSASTIGSSRTCRQAATCSFCSSFRPSQPVRSTATVASSAIWIGPWTGPPSSPGSTSPSTRS